VRTPQLSSRLAIDSIAQYDPKVGDAILREQARQVSGVEKAAKPAFRDHSAGVLTARHRLK
jgi:hypothetical protein